MLLNLMKLWFVIFVLGPAILYAALFVGALLGG